MATTFLEMNSSTDLKYKSSPDPLFMVNKMNVKQWQVNKFLYQYVGGDWQWNNRLGWTDEEWMYYVNSALVHTWLGLKEGSIVGYFELQEQGSGVEIAYFGITPPFIGKGYGGYLLCRCLEEAWRLNPGRVWVHTCSLDHPAALPNYISRGMKVYKILPENL